MKLGKNKLQELKDKKLQFEELNDRYFIDSKDEIEVENILDLLNNSICSFQQIVDKIKRIRDRFEDSCLYVLFYNEKIFQKLFENYQLTTNDLRYLLDEVSNSDDVSYLSGNKPLMRVLYENCVLTKEDIDKFHTIIRNFQYWIDELKNADFFKFVEYDGKFCFNHETRKWSEKTENEIDHDLLKLNDLNKCFYEINCSEFLFSLNAEQKRKLLETLKDNGVALDRFKLVIENHLENDYDFESLLNYLKKSVKKNLINI